jgi:hypothetical protein
MALAVGASLVRSNGCIMCSVVSRRARFRAITLSSSTFFLLVQMLHEGKSAKQAAQKGAKKKKKTVRRDSKASTCASQSLWAFARCDWGYLPRYSPRCCVVPSLCSLFFADHPTQCPALVAGVGIKFSIIAPLNLSALKTYV